MLKVGDKFLLEEKTISYVTSAREIVRLTGTQPKAASQPHSRKSLVMGNPDFDLDLAKANVSESATQRMAAAAPLRSLSRDCHGLTFKPLPNAEAEARSVAKLLGKEAVLRLGAEARKAELQAVQAPRVLHLATHAFFLSDQEFKQMNSGGRNLAFAEFGSDKGRPSSDWENPMVRCGVALAGANHAREIIDATADDGLLTGLEASLLNLQGTELVVLSACDSGSGEVKIGEGVMSLSRAFRIAGAQTVLASHWTVSDKATSELMTEFMRRWRAGESRASAWHNAQLTLLHSKNFSDPFFWAAFTLTGEW
jgi:CHAT domain-containing protein